MTFAMLRPAGVTDPPERRAGLDHVPRAWSGCYTTV